MSLKKIKNYLEKEFDLTASQIRSISVLSFLLILLITGKSFYKIWQADISPVTEVQAKLLDSLSSAVPQKDFTEKSFNIFKFNPNTASEEDLVSLGFNKWTSKNIIKYRSKGGVFKIKKDLFKIYNIDSTLILTLYDSINLPENISQPKKSNYSKKIGPIKSQAIAKKLRKFNINKITDADKEDFKSIRPYIFDRMISFRNKLGGIVDKAQIKEIYGINNDEIDLLIKHASISSDFTPKKINIQNATFKQLIQHPYLNYEQTKAIFAAKKEDSILNFQILKAKIPSISLQLEPYISYE
ncbi:helix-hairpin-helix domain-containing protein [Aureibacter tunicatorum]|uniref:DNA uptake protein ComE-like DNA-binding protein n=1 Tax=Aureibacter tunicatorum TaxID=866807 RepID=A0AAE4BP86_9BACT|nr:helix-hairpin-helix domain-containing protein [Aureibacter tunicatorum]MDR6237699.1 DNA uptake protein ComE-like DNA-binding protein [Aureibacter tunicatorum]BDD02734.1 competence protein ComEA [Aureibacter tunicatorum]